MNRGVPELLDEVGRSSRPLGAGAWPEIGLAEQVHAIIVDGQLLGTVNCLDKENYFTLEKINELEKIKLPAISCFLLNLIKKT